MEQLKKLFAEWAGVPCTECLQLGANGSARRYYRLVGSSQSSVIGCINDDVRENEAFFAYCRHFHSRGIRVPELYAVSGDHRHYLQQDLGDQTLYGLLFDKKRAGGGFDAEMLAFYRQALADLAAIQQAGRDLDFSVAYPRPAFDRRSILWDLNYFKYYYLKLAHVPFDEELLENDFSALADRLLQADCNYFLYRDFNPRNIMLVDSGQCVVGSTRDQMLSTGMPRELDERPHYPLPITHYPLPTKSLYYIDFQGGRRGAAQYDVASLLYSAKSDLPEVIRTELLNHYLDVRHINGDDRRRWLHDFWNYLLIRILQTLGAYGYRGLYERKPYFVESIPLALANLRLLVEEHPQVLDGLDELKNIVGSRLSVVVSGQWSVVSTELTVTVQSFSYKQGLPDDPSGNGGGHIFDCRALPNPGRYPEYKAYTGMDRPVIEFLCGQPPVERFLKHTQDIVAQSVDKYLERNFTNLSVAFGCTGGQHRSVYCAERTAQWLRETYPQVNVQLLHREQQR